MDEITTLKNELKVKQHEHHVLKNKLDKCTAAIARIQRRIARIELTELGLRVGQKCHITQAYIDWYKQEKGTRAKVNPQTPLELRSSALNNRLRLCGPSIDITVPIDRLSEFVRFS